MDKKKMIGTIIGVILFGALIAGATFALRSFTATLTNNSANVTTGSFTFNYSSPVGSNLTTIQSFSGMPARNSFSGGNGYIELVATKIGSNSPYASHFQLYLKRTIWGIDVTGAIKYAVCRSATASDCNNSASTVIPSTTNDKWAVVNGTITNEIDNIESSGFSLYDDTATLNTGNSPFKVLGTATGYYYIYIWLDASTVTNENIDDVDGKEISAYIYAKATQGE